jgi:hypothetical protein
MGVMLRRWLADSLPPTRVAWAAILPQLARFPPRAGGRIRSLHMRGAVVQVTEELPRWHIRVCGMLACRERLHCLRILVCWFLECIPRLQELGVRVRA